MPNITLIVIVIIIITPLPKWAIYFVEYFVDEIFTEPGRKFARALVTKTIPLDGIFSTAPVHALCLSLAWFFNQF